MHDAETALPSATSIIPRRSLIKGAAWSVPTIAAAVATPLAAASTGCPDGGDMWTSADPGAGIGVHSIEIPDCVETIDYVVRGGGGALITPSNHTNTGTGAEYRGTLALSNWSGGTFTVVVADGGEALQRGKAAGGSGYGRGGAGTDTSANGGTNGWSCGGGGGSAILYASQPLVVAGGGGGGAIPITKSRPDTEELLVEAIFLRDLHEESGAHFGRGNAGTDAMSANASGAALRLPGADAPSALVRQARSGDNGGLSLPGTWSDPSHFTRAESIPGSNGSRHGSGENNGGNGGDAAPETPNFTLPGESEPLLLTPAGGGGGGGYHGGGGGSFAFFRDESSGFPHQAVAASSGGGAGSSYSAGSVVDDSSGATIQVSGELTAFTEAAPDSRDGHIGYVELIWR